LFSGGRFFGLEPARKIGRLGGGPMVLNPIQVECYAGYRADETPRRFILEEQRLEVLEVLDRWHEAGGHPEWPRADYFKVLAADQHQYLLKHDLEADEWFLARRW